MSTWITFKKINTVEADTLFKSIKEGIYQREASREFLELEKELVKYPEITDEEIYGPASSTEEKQSEIENRLTKRRSTLDSLQKIEMVLSAIKELAENANTEDFNEHVSELARSIIDYTGQYFSENIRSVEPCTNLLFSHSGIPEKIYFDLENVPFETWEKVFEGLDKAVLNEVFDDIKKQLELENNKDGQVLEEEFRYFVNIIKEIKLVFKDCDNKKVIFDVSVEGGESKNAYVENLEQQIIESFNEKPFLNVPLSNIKSYLFVD